MSFYYEIFLKILELNTLIAAYQIGSNLLIARISSMRFPFLIEILINISCHFAFNKIVLIQDALIKLINRIIAAYHSYLNLLTEII